jgi:hypothetical protein
VAIAFSATAATSCTLLYDTEDLSGGAPPRASIDASPEDVRTFAPPVDGASVLDVDAAEPAGRVTEGLVAFFAFDEKDGAIVHDTADGGDRLELALRAAPAPDGDGGALEAGPSPGVTWAPEYLTVSGRAIGESTAPAKAIQTRCAASGQLTVEAWVRPLTRSQFGPARIVTMSYTGAETRNFTLGQSGGNLVFRIRTDAGYKEIERVGALEDKAGVLVHLLVTARATGEVAFYVDGVPSTDLVPNASFDFAEYGLAIANEIDGFQSERRWRGDYHLVAIYDRALTAAEATRNFRAGADPRP